MPSEIAQKIVSQIFGDDKAAAIDSINDGIGAAAFNAVQDRKLEYAKNMGFELNDQEESEEDDSEYVDEPPNQQPVEALETEEDTDETDR